MPLRCSDPDMFSFAVLSPLNRREMSSRKKTHQRRRREGKRKTRKDILEEENNLVCTEGTEK
jgi:hypothetical protein